MLKSWSIKLLIFLQCCVKNWVIFGVFCIFQCDRPKLAQGAIYLYFTSVAETFLVSLAMFFVSCFHVLELYLQQSYQKL